MRYDEPRPVCTSLPITNRNHAFDNDFHLDMQRAGGLALA
jgi:hypothetical protein